MQNKILPFSHMEPVRRISMSIPPSAQCVHSTASYAPASLESSITRAISSSVSVLREQHMTSDSEFSVGKSTGI